MLLLSWIAQGGGHGIVTLDLLNCTEVRSVASPTHPSARDDVGTTAAKAQTANTQAESFGELGLMETLCPFQLFYSNGVERLGAESARERVRWVSAIWGFLTAQSQCPIDPKHSLLRALCIQSGQCAGSLSRQLSLHSRTVDDAAISNQTITNPGDPWVVAPSCSSSLHRTTSLTDLGEEFESALQRAKDSRPGLGFGLGLAGAIIAEGSRDHVKWTDAPPSPPTTRTRSRDAITFQAARHHLDHLARPQTPFHHLILPFIISFPFITCLSQYSFSYIKIP
ncbi:hypothetical protein F5148DRAFT_1177465 [Russula earlei]|uniref:Uncharacterized protein n=1 Tax=Russula earlei TaxID=71964 RepID=A0ACC0UGM6_9AGAM|nr:hypothetical protein F5148DRAFT_1177465 [Russula earlei]